MIPFDKSEPRMRLLLELMLVHVAYATSQPSLARVAAVRLCVCQLKRTHQQIRPPVLRTLNSQLSTLHCPSPGSRSVPVSGNLTEAPSPRQVSHDQLSIFVEHIISQRPSLTLRYSPIFCDILLYNFNCHMIHSSSHHTRSIFPA